MDRRINKKVDTYMSTFKDDIKTKASELGLSLDTNIGQLIQYIYDYERINFSCPICRSNLGYPDLYSRYSYIYPKVNNLDILEDFWLAKDFKTIQMCSKGRNHSLGMNKSCRSCLKYRKTGM